jgi:hypothetical protein
MSAADLRRLTRGVDDQVVTHHDLLGSIVCSCLIT